MGDSLSLIILGGCAIVLIFSFASTARSTKATKTSLTNQDDARQRGERLLASVAETNQLLRELIATVRDKR
jgi:hypothetical protein